MKTFDLSYLISRIQIDSVGCWNWTKSRTPEGYGHLHIHCKYWYAHRFSWVLHYGNIPEHLHVLHKCDNPGCVNPEHLFLGTHQDNMHDRDLKGRGRHGNSKGLGPNSISKVPIILDLLKRGHSFNHIRRTLKIGYETIIKVIKLYQEDV